MNTQTQVSPESRASGVAEKLRAIDWERVGVFYARLALGSAFLSRSPPGSACGTARST